MTFSDLVATATVGTAQRPAPDLPAGLVLEAVAGQSAAARVLDAAAAYAVLGRAQLPTYADVSPTPTAPPDPRPEPPERFTAALAKQLAHSDGGAAEPSAATSAGLLAEALGWLGEAGWRLPDRMLVGVLQRAARSRAVASAAAPALGSKGEWLASFNPEWAVALAGERTTTGPDESDWHEGNPQQRLAYLRTLRSQDPDAARDLLALTWAKEPVAERVSFAELVSATAQPSDETFLVAALADRSKRVAEAARPGLLRIPSSGLLGRLRLRARRAVTVRRGLSGRTVHVEPPADDPSAAADGLTSGTYSRTLAENRLNALVASIPPPEWPGLVGVPAGELIGATAPESWTVVPGLVEAATFWRDPQLADDLVSAGIRTPALLALLGEARLATILDDPGAGLDAAAVHAIVLALPPRWSPGLATALGAWIQRQLSQRRGVGEIPPLLWERIPTSVPPVVARGWAERLRGTASDPRLSFASQRRVRLVATLLTLRAAMYDDVRAALETPGTHRHQEER